MSLTRKKQRQQQAVESTGMQGRQIRARQDDAQQQPSQQSILSICLNRQQDASQIVHQSSNNTPSSASASYRQHGQLPKHHHQTVDQQLQQPQRPSKQNAASGIGKKSSGLKHSFQKGQKQQALIQSITNAGNQTVTAVVARAPISQTPVSSGPAVSGTGSNINAVGATSSSANFSCLIQKQRTSLNYGEHPTGSNQNNNHSQGRHSNQSVRNSGGANLPQVSSSLEKLSTGGGATNGPSVQRNSGGNFALSQADLQHLHGGRATSSSQHNSVKGGGVATQANQYRGSQQPQQKHKIKAFKRIDAVEISSKAMMSQVSVSSALSRNSGKRPSSNFVSLGGQSRTTNANVETSSQGTTALKPPEPQKFKQGCQIPSSNPSLRNSLMSGVGGSMTGMPVSMKPAVAADTTATSIYARSSSQQQQQSAVTKLGAATRAERIASSRGGKKPSMKVVRLTGSSSRTKDRLSSSSARSGGGGAHQKHPQSGNSGQRRPEEPAQQNTTPGKHSSRRRRTASSSQKKSSNAGRVAVDVSSSPSATSNNAAGAEASYCPKQQLLNSSQEIVARNNQLPQQVHVINSSNQACLLPGHFVQANGPSSMQASSRPIKHGGGNVAGAGFLPPQNILLSASFEKLNLLSSQQHNATTKSGVAMHEIRNQVLQQQQQKHMQHQQQNTSGTATSISSHSQNTTLRSHQQILRQNATKMQNFINGQINPSQVGSLPQGKALPYGNLKVKKQGIKTTMKHQLTPQRIKKVTKDQQQPPTQKTNMTVSALDMTQKSIKQTNTKAQQYLRNSFMIKHHQNGSSKNMAAGTGSVSPRSNSGKHHTLMAVGISRNSQHPAQAHTVNGLMPVTQSVSVQQSQQQSMLNTTNNSSNMAQPRLSPMSGSHHHQQQQLQNNNNVSKFKPIMPKNLNILAKGSGGMSKTFKQNNIESAVQQQQSQQQQLTQQQKMMIDKKTYEDLMNYLVKTECKRLKQDPNAPKASGPLMVSTPNHLSSKPIPSISNSTSNLNSINSTQQRRNTSTKKPKMAIQHPPSSSASHSTFQSVQPVRQNNVGVAVWQPQMTLNQTLSKQLAAIDLPTADSAMINGEAHSAETLKQHPLTMNHRQIPANISQVATVSTFMPTTTTTSGKGIKMLKTAISQSQSRDASLTSQNTNENVGRSGHPKHDHNAVMLAAQRKYPSKQVHNSRNGGVQKAPTHQLSLKGTKAGQSRNGGAALLSALSGIKTGAATNVNNTVFSVSVKPGNGSNQTMLGGIQQASPNQTFIIQPSKGQSRNGKKSALGTSGGTIPTKIIKARSLIRGAPGQAPLGGAKSVMNVLKRQGMTDSGAKVAGGYHQETLKNNFMQHQDGNEQVTVDASLSASVNTLNGGGVPPKLPTGRSGTVNVTGNGGGSKTPALRELQLKALNLPIRERVQSAKSSSTNQQQQNLSSSQSNQKASLLGGRGGNNPSISNQFGNGSGALSHRESQRYFSRPSDEQGQPQPQSSAQARKMLIKQPIERPRSRSKLSAVQQSQSHINNSKERKRSLKQESCSKDQSSRKNRKRHSNSSARAAKTSTRQRSSTVDRGSSLKKANGSNKGGNSSLVGMLPLDIMAGQAEPHELDAGSSAIGENTIVSSGTNLIDTIVLNSSDIIGNNKAAHRLTSGKTDASACMTGDNFNTFGEHALSELEEGEGSSGGPTGAVHASSTKLIEQIEHQIDQELREGKNSRVVRDPKFELMLLHDQQSNESGENTLDEQKPPQNSLIAEQQALVNSSGEVLLQTLQSRGTRSPKVNPDSKASLKDFHYSGSFGIPNSSSNATIQNDRELIEIEPAQLYEEEIEVVQPSTQTHHQVDQQQSVQKPKSKFQLINMSFSQEALAAAVPQKNPNNTLIIDAVPGQKNTAEKQVSDKLYQDADYRKQLLLRVLPDFKKLDQFDQLHNDIIYQQVEAPPEQDIEKDDREQMSVSRGAAQLLRQINLSLGRDSMDEQKHQHVSLVVGAEDAIDDDIDDDLMLETNTVVENECDSEFQYLYHGSSSGANAVNRDFSSPSVTSDRQGLIKSFDTTSIHSPQNQTCIELQTPSNLTSVFQSHQASQNTTNLYQYSCEEETRLTLLQSSEPESNRKQGGAFAVFSPRTAAIYEDGANGGKQAILAPNSVRHSKQLDEETAGKELFLPRFGAVASSLEGSTTLADGEEAEEEEENQSFQTMLVEGEAVESLGGGETPDPQVTSFYGPEQPQYEEIVSIMQTDAYAGDLIDEHILGRHDHQLRGIGNRSPGIIATQMSADEEDEENDTGGGSVAASHSPHSIRKDGGAYSRYQNAELGDSDLKDAQPYDNEGKSVVEDDQDEDDDQFQFVENLNKQYADAMQQRKIMKMMNKPRQNSC